MKHILNLILIVFSIGVNGQRADQIPDWLEEGYNITKPCDQECKDNLLKNDFSSLWTKNDNKITFGFIGANFQRLRIIIITTNKNKTNPDIYYITGKSMVKDYICQYNGIIQITQINIYQNMHFGVDDMYKDKGIKCEGILTARYKFIEDSSQINSGIFEGTLNSWWYIDKNGNIQYDNIASVSDTYCNNQFIGTWTSNKTKNKKVCNWGDYRIPFSGDLDIGAGEFSPDDKYLQYGWKTYRDAYTNNNEEAKLIEEKQWWK
jgi:hypothetical protein